MQYKIKQRKHHTKERCIFMSKFKFIYSKLKFLRKSVVCNLNLSRQNAFCFNFILKILFLKLLWKKSVAVPVKHWRSEIQVSPDIATISISSLVNHRQNSRIISTYNLVKLALNQSFNLNNSWLSGTTHAFLIGVLALADHVLNSQ